jgi:predicted permease
MHFGKLGKAEIVAAVGGILLGVCVLAPWYEASADNPNAMVAGMRGAVSAWEAHSILRYVFLAAAIAPVILIYIVVRDHELSWPRGEMTAVVAIAAFGIIGYLGIIDRPGEPPGEISLQWGWIGAMLGVIMMMVGGALRASGTERPRKPPGVL